MFLPTIYLSVPAGYAALLPFLEKDEKLARKFFANLRLIFYAGASLPQDLWERLENLSVRTIGERVPMASSWGTTETAPMALAGTIARDRAGVIGTPGARRGNKTRAERRKTRGARPRPEHHAGLLEAAGSDGGRVRRRRVLQTGDAVRFVDPADPSKGSCLRRPPCRGLQAHDRNMGRVRALRIGASPPLARLAGRGHRAGTTADFVGILAWLNAAGCQKLIGEGAPSTLPGTCARISA